MLDSLRNICYNKYSERLLSMTHAEKQITVSFVRCYKLTDHTCPVCGTVFQAPRLRVYCSLDCKQRASWERNRAEYNKRRRTKYRTKEAKTVKGANNETAQ